MEEIKITTDYSLFKRIAGNRQISKAHVRKLKLSIAQDTNYTKYNPIIVNEKYEIIDGQHRLEAIEQLASGMPVYYIQESGLGLKNVQKLNSLSKSWTPIDYAKSYIELGNEHYQAYIDFKNRYQLNHEVLLEYLGLDKRVRSGDFKEGKFQAIDHKRSHDLIAKLIDMGKYYKKYNKRSFAFAFKRICENPLYDHEHMKHKLELHGKLLHDFSVPEEYMRCLEYIYNLHAREGNGEKRVRFF